MKQTVLYTTVISIFHFSCTGIFEEKPNKSRHTIVSINGKKFLINGQPAYKARTWQGYPIEGLLMNSRVEAVKVSASWGYFDYRLKGETSFDESYQSVPVNWGISSERKKGSLINWKKLPEV